MKESNTKTKDKIIWRRNKVNELSIKGFSQAEISRMLQISEATISKDITFLKEEAKETIKNHIHDKLPYEYKKCISGLEEIIKESWIILAHSEKIGNTKDKISSLALIKDTYNTKMDLLTNASLLQDSIKFVEQNKDKLVSGSNDLHINKKDKENGIQGSTEDNSDQSEQYNQVY
jgi:hypothetical protein